MADCRLPSVIAVDGPAAAGKSAFARRLADALEYAYFDSGALYRAITWQAIRRGLDPGDEDALSALTTGLDVRVERAPVGESQASRVIVNEEDVTNALFRPEVDALVSRVSAHPRVRQQLLPLQRTIARQGRVVIAGRDIGTVVVPDAPLKIFIRASIETRARRRYEQLRKDGVDVNLATIRAEIERRDRLDSERAVAPMAIAPDALVLDTDEMTLEDEVNLVLEKIGCATR